MLFKNLNCSTSPTKIFLYNAWFFRYFHFLNRDISLIFASRINYSPLKNAKYNIAWVIFVETLCILKFNMINLRLPHLPAQLEILVSRNYYTTDKSLANHWEKCYEKFWLFVVYTANKWKQKLQLYYNNNTLSKNDMHTVRLFAKFQQFWTEGCWVTEF